MKGVELKREVMDKKYGDVSSPYREFGIKTVYDDARKKKKLIILRGFSKMLRGHKKKLKRRKYLYGVGK